MSHHDKFQYDKNTGVLCAVFSGGKDGQGSPSMLGFESKEMLKVLRQILWCPRTLLCYLAFPNKDWYF